MATSPQPPHPPAPPRPAGSPSHIVAIALLVLLLIVVVAGIGIWSGLSFLSNVHVQVKQDRGGQKQVSIKTPVGSMQVNKGVDEASLGLPIYPGAIPLKEKGSATVNFDILDEAKFQVLAGKFETSDSLDKVRAFYHDRLGDQVTKYKDRDEEGKTVFEIKHDKQERVVALKRHGDKTVIELVRVSEGSSEAN